MAVALAIYYFSKKKAAHQEEAPKVNSNTKPTPTAPNYNDLTVFSLKSPYMVDWRVGNIQISYNFIADQKGWPKIKEDNIFGSETAAALNKWLGKTAVSWAEIASINKHS